MNAPFAQHPVATSRFGYPFKDRQGREIADPHAFLRALIPVQGGHYLLGARDFFHGGIHLDRACKATLAMEDGIRCLGDGEVVACRFDADHHDATPGRVGAANMRPYSTSFVLVRHRIQAPLPSQPPVPAPMEVFNEDFASTAVRPDAEVASSSCPTFIGSEVTAWSTWMHRHEPTGQVRIRAAHRCARGPAHVLVRIPVVGARLWSKSFVGG